MKREPMVEEVEQSQHDTEREQKLLREAMGLFEEKRYSEALLACEGVLVLNPESIPALSLKGAIHERLGQIPEAIRAYERVLELNPLSVSERLRLEALRGQIQMQVKTTRDTPLWKETLPVVLAFIGTSIVLIVGLMLVLRMSAPSGTPTMSAQLPQENASPATLPQRPEFSRPQPPTEPETPTTVPTPTPPPAPSGAVPPVVIDPSQVALAPANPPAPNSGMRGPIPPLPAPSANENGRTQERPEPPAPSPSAQNRSEVMPDVQVRETEQRGVYEIRVQRAEGANRTQRTSPQNDALSLAQNYQRAGNYREALNAYRQALAQAELKGDILQQMAICYLRLGDLANARQHFQQAISEYERQIQLGRDVESARQGILACQNGLRLCEE